MAELIALGVSKVGIAIGLGIGPSVIASDLAKLNMRAKPRERNPHYADYFSRAFTRYAELHEHRPRVPSSVSLYVALGKIIREEYACEFIRGVLTAERFLEAWESAVPEHERYRVFLNVLFGKNVEQNPLTHEEAQDIWEAFVTSVGKGEKPSPESYEALTEELRHTALSRTIEDRELFFGNLVRPLVETILNKLPHREVRIVRKHFGLYGDTPRTLHQIGQSEKTGPISVASLKKIEARLLRSLREAPYGEMLRPLVETRQELVAGHIRRVVSLHHVLQGATPARVDPRLLDSVRVLDLSAIVERTLRRLLSVSYVADLVQYTEADLAQTQGMGPKGVAEIQEKLKERGLSLGVLFTPEVRATLKQILYGHIPRLSAE